MRTVEWGGLQVFQIVAFVGLALTAHLVMAHARKPLVKKVHEDTRAPVRELFLIADAVLVLLYLAFIAASFTLVGGVDPKDYEIDQVLNRLAGFAVYVAALEVSALTLIVRLSHGMDPWPSRHVPARTAVA